MNIVWHKLGEKVSKLLPDGLNGWSKYATIVSQAPFKQKHVYEKCSMRSPKTDCPSAPSVQPFQKNGILNDCISGLFRVHHVYFQYTRRHGGPYQPH